MGTPKGQLLEEGPNWLWDPHTPTQSVESVWSVPGPSPYPGAGPICRIAPPSSPTPPQAPRTDRFYTSARPLRGGPPDSTDCLLNCRGKRRPRKLDLPRNTPKSHLIGHKSSLWYCFCTRIPKIAVPRPKSFIFVAFCKKCSKCDFSSPECENPKICLPPDTSGRTRSPSSAKRASTTPILHFKRQSVELGVPRRGGRAEV